MMPSGGAPSAALNDRFFWELLGLSPGAERRAIKRAYYRKARENHPDFFPEAARDVQGIKMIALNEAYAHLMSLPAPVARPAAAGRDPVARPAAAGRGAAGWVDRAPTGTAVGPHKEPAYAYYKQGFVHFSRAIHGIEALYQSIARHHGIHFRPRDDAFERFAGSLLELRRAHEYFTRVVREHAGSIWRRDAELKLARIERFSALYRRIIGNLTGPG
ncbi:MAG: J domain-containing protein [Spirochaetales bacterium]|nr:J domain-containing protein [Spirochaetales bacterium]